MDSPETLPEGLGTGVVGTAGALSLPWRRASFHLSVLHIGLFLPECLLKERVFEADGS